MGETKKMQKRSKWQQTKLEMKKYKMSYVMIAPYFILFFLFTVLPVLASIGISFTDFNMLETPNFVGWRNYIKLLLDDDVFKKAFKNTIIFAVVTGPLSYIMCFLFAWIINEFKGKLRAFLTLIFYAPSISGNAFMVWSIIISGDRYGYLNGWLMKWSFLYEPIQWMKTEKYVLPILIIVQLWLSLGTGFLTFIAGLQTVDKSLYEAGAMDGIKNPKARASRLPTVYNTAFPVCGQLLIIASTLMMCISSSLTGLFSVASANPLPGLTVM